MKDRWRDNENYIGACLDILKCPRCDNVLTRTKDSRQVGIGPSGFWYNYRCESCKYFVDRKEHDL